MKSYCLIVLYLCLLLGCASPSLQPAEKSTSPASDAQVERQRDQPECPNAQEEDKELETKLIELEYSDPESIANLIEEYFQSLPEQNQCRRGTVSADWRTRTLFVQDTTENIRKIEEIVATLDRRTPQVMFEVRVVLLPASFREELGIRWVKKLTGIRSREELGLHYWLEGNPASKGVLSIGQIGKLEHALTSDELLPLFTRIDEAEKAGLVKVLTTPKIFSQDSVMPSFDVVFDPHFFRNFGKDEQQPTTLGGEQISLKFDIHFHFLDFDARTISIVFKEMYAEDVMPLLRKNLSSFLQPEPVRGEVDILMKDEETTIFGRFFPTVEHTNSQNKPELLIFLTPHVLDRYSR